MPWRRRALSAVALMTIAVAGERVTMAAAGRDLENGRMACGDVPRPPVGLYLIDRAGLSAEARVELMRETLAPWRAAGAALEWSTQLPSRPAGLGEAKALYVLIEADADETTDLRHLPMASILFTNGQPATHITVHAGHVARRLAALRIGDRVLADHPRVLRDRILGRVLGRAAAHEVGHFLSGSREHQSSGLMRASHRIEHLMTPDHPMFRLRPAASAGCLVARSEGG